MWTLSQALFGRSGRNIGKQVRDNWCTNAISQRNKGESDQKSM
jgi:hypothetical protein